MSFYPVTSVGPTYVHVSLEEWPNNSIASEGVDSVDYFPTSWGVIVITWLWGITWYVCSKPQWHRVEGWWCNTLWYYMLNYHVMLPCNSTIKYHNYSHDFINKSLLIWEWQVVAHHRSKKISSDQKKTILVI